MSIGAERAETQPLDEQAWDEGDSPAPESFIEERFAQAEAPPPKGNRALAGLLVAPAGDRSGQLKPKADRLAPPHRQRVADAPVQSPIRTFPSVSHRLHRSLLCVQPRAAPAGKP